MGSIGVLEAYSLELRRSSEKSPLAYMHAYAYASVETQSATATVAAR